MKQKGIFRAFAFAMAIAMIAVCFASCEKKQQRPEFVPPPFDSGAVVGSPDAEVLADKGYEELDAQAYKLWVCGKIVLDGNKADLYFTNPETNNVWLKLRILDTNGNKLGETGIVRPGEYVQTITFDVVPKVGDSITIKIMGYEPDTYYSAGSVNLNTAVY